MNRQRWLSLLAVIVVGVFIACLVAPRLSNYVPSSYVPTERQSVETSTSSVPVRQPSYIKDVVAYREGYKAFFCYFVLADAEGREVACNGSLTVELHGGYQTPIYKSNLYAYAHDFRWATVGLGSFERERLIYSLGRITYDSFSRQPISSVGEVTIRFTPAKTGKVLIGKASLILDED